MAKTQEAEAPVTEEPVAVVEPGQSIQDAISAASPFDAAIGGEVLEADEIAAANEEYTSPTGLAGLTATPVFERDEVSLPLLRLAQGLTPEVASGAARPGQWVLNGEEAQDVVHFVPLLCGIDHVHKDGDGRVILNCTNKACPERQWTEDPRGGRNKPPTCIRIWRYLGWVQEFDRIAEIHLQKSGEYTAKAINTFIQTRGMGNFALEMGMKSEAGPRNSTYFVATAKLHGLPALEMQTARRALAAGE